ncbi:MAG: hypothetical protein CL918_01700 [Deltaproteobacteria bacterium]|nr:hypothetical protein [Deltaproteobacteria bacterium]
MKTELSQPPLNCGSHPSQTTPKKMTTFTTPQNVKFDFYWETLKAYDERAEKFADQAQAFFKEGRKTTKDFILEEGDDIRPSKWGRSQAELRWKEFDKKWDHFANHPFLSCHWNDDQRTDICMVLPNPKGTSRAVWERADSAAKVLEVKVNGLLKEGERFQHSLRLNPANDLIEGSLWGKETVDGKKREFKIKVRMIWNYRYGENSANGVLTQYTQFRGSRH